MNKLMLKNKTGFTIIEVVLVIAIAGLIFLMVFLALPALQTEQRDTQRRKDLAQALANINNFRSNNAGRYPLTVDDFNRLKGYLDTQRADGSVFRDPNGTDYNFVYKVASANADDNKTEGQVGDGKITYFAFARCEGVKIVRADTQGRIALAINLEGGGKFYCLNYNE